ncbi:MAG: Thivi_2564 family membrane protein [Chitinophagaceae bacterium]
MQPLITVVITLVIVGVVLYLINNYIPMSSSIKSILNIVVIIAVVIWLLKYFNVWNGFAL